RGDYCSLARLGSRRRSNQHGKYHVIHLREYYEKEKVRLGSIDKPRELVMGKQGDVPVAISSSAGQAVGQAAGVIVGA
ncbi:hypothetical protein HaLaN_31313, partial [Haematococcus lacustris]